MGKYDNMDREYFGSPRRLAQLFSIGMFKGRIRIDKDSLEAYESRYISLRSESGTIQRDCISLWRSEGVLLALEIETKADYRMSERIMIYDACEYEKQLESLSAKRRQEKSLSSFIERKSGMLESDKIYPVINIVLYLGEGHWNGNSTLKGLFKFNGKYGNELYEKAENYNICVIEADYVDPNLFETDLKCFFMAMRCRKDESKLKKLLATEDFRQLDTYTQRIIALHLNDKTIFKRVIEEEQDMCKALDDWAKREREEGYEEGCKAMRDWAKRERAEGYAEGCKALHDWAKREREEGYDNAILTGIRLLIKKQNISIDDAMDIFEVDANKRERYRALI